ncbi:MAG: hypothetical protein A2268_07955 [Candidatus Raymondbacteria bacterium RifOxyA12_full_50_37]|uniref:histidine kinase n=1 Tax=Candidatus Raymondbacteria bacterium RIFOXYD12_FULL_49_13 TaxID=1817890 RepID=A0A1F7FJN8_UNCRA|nr:MAG: hypothetical protein A2350_13145 [Candidatus Raymondbacteria bacterium RifOxyB12_full_50_8]OGJ91741.1 MAG: hypothetical protein A2268_07955 [Candidatus Raymondbacteria bacterium RifOxyA12_full_50_37]OGJ93501.1 MAG: hypothetical protein A2248_09000 [Candidatus Raymondbacteria bacterium RIFOXYA2_FULL_49_16]OGJ98771.1 MAG: hypothetical protein A2453_09810 [Candidatus Raymondbacteria bacterium RIFOXYC2_FULL_50_21]OGK06935.1 MAG: hypothetical protein A2519_05825 [Candidatus Raymondbacteria b
MEKVKSRFNLLLIDGNPDDASAIKELIGESDELDLVHADRLSIGLEHLSQGGVDLVLLDLGLPDSQGLNTLAKVATRTPSVPIVVLTGCEDDEISLVTLGMGAQDYLHKQRIDSYVLSRSIRYSIERKRIEQTLLDRERKLKEAQRLGSIGHWEYDIGSRTIIWSDMVYRLYGRDLEKGPPTEEEEAAYYTPETATLLRECFKKSLDTGEPYEVDVRVMPESGEERTFTVIGTPVRNEEGRVFRFLGTIQDITERKQAEEARCVSEVRYRRLFESAKDGILILDADTGVIVDVNPFLIEILGYSKEYFLGKTVWELGFLKDIIANQDNFLKLQQQEYIRYEHLPLKTADGRCVDVEFVSNVYLVDNKKVIQCNIRDITARRRAEIERERLAAAIAQAGEMVVITDSTAAIQYVNPAFERITGYTREEAVGQNPRILRSGMQDNVFYRKLWEAISNGRTWEGRFVNKKKNGDHYTEEANISPVRDAIGNIVSYVAVKRDITKEISMESQLRQSQKMEAIGQLAGGVAHDINNVLTAIHGYSSLALGRLKEDSPLKHDLEQIALNANRAADIIRQLLLFSRKQPMEFRAFDLNKTVTSLLKMLERIIGEDVRVKTELPQDLKPVSGDAGTIEQVIMNLAVNARDAMPSGGTITISTANENVGVEYCHTHTFARTGLFVCMAIADTGTGIVPQNLEHIFEPFFTTKKDGKGTGLGLSVVYGIVKQHNGWITVDSQEGKGTAFKVYFPASGENIEPRRVPDKAKRAKELKGRGELVLVIEDQTDVRELAVQVLETSGYMVITAGSVADARKIYTEKANVIKAVISDIVLPDGTGIAFAEECIHATQLAPAVLFTSGYTDDRSHYDIIHKKGYRFLPKPYTVENLLVALREMLEQAKA